MVLPAILEGFNMRATRWLLGMGTAFSVLSAVAAGCGSSTTGSSPAQDSGTTDVSMMEAAVEAAPEAAAEAAAEATVDAACVPDAMITSFSASDAAIGDAGATAATCLACFEAACPATITKCDMSCACVSAFESFTACFAAGGSLTTCGAGLLGGSAGLGISDIICAAGCAVPQTCGVTLPTGDGGGGDGGDAGTTD
jgi:hypothetical protein